MKPQNILSLLFTFLFSLTAFSSDFDLGGNEELIKRAQKYQNTKKVKIVQKRAVDRNWRFEFSALSGLSSGGDAYYDTNQFGALIDIHATPKFSFGYRYLNFSNTLNAEGERIFDIAKANSRRNQSIVEFDFPIDAHIGQVTWYPIYGKTNFFDLSVIQFDFYGSLGAGQIALDSGNTPITQFATGVGVWWNNYLTSRFEVSFQNYRDIVADQPRSISYVTGALMMGVLL